MIKIENVEVIGWEHAIRGMRNPLNSWIKSDSYHLGACPTDDCNKCEYLGNACIDRKMGYFIGENDLSLMRRLSKAGTDHRKFMRMLVCYVDLTCPLYFWKEFDTYKVGTVANSCSTMHKIQEKEFTLDDFSCEHLEDAFPGTFIRICDDHITVSPKQLLEDFIIPVLNHNRTEFIETDDKKYWWQMIQLLPSSYNQKRTVMLSYEVLANMYKSRKNHKLDEWREFCKWIETLPYSELITREEK